MGLIVEVFDIDDLHNQTIHDSIDFYGRTLLDLRIDRSVEVARPQRLYLRSLFGTYTNLTADFSVRSRLVFRLTVLTGMCEISFSSTAQLIIMEMNAKHTAPPIHRDMNVIRLLAKKFVKMDISATIV